MHILGFFKGFEYAQLNLFEPLTVLIGANGSGKSNVIEGVELLSFLVHGHPLHKVSEVAIDPGGLQVRGGLQSCATHGSGVFFLGFDAWIRFLGKKKRFTYLVHVWVDDPHPHIVGETLGFYEGPMIFQTLGPTASPASGDIKVEYNNFARGGRKPVAHVSRSYSVISQYKQFAYKNQKYETCVRLLDGIMNYLRSSFVFDPNPKLMRSYERIGNNVLLRDGGNISAVLYDLSVGDDKKQESLNRLLGWIRQLPQEPYENIEFVTTELNDVIFGLREANGGPLNDARLLSDGTLRCTAVLTALETVAPNSRIIIEEFDNGLHPSRVNVLTKAIEDCCKRRKLNVLVTTHNPATLNGLEEDQLDGVVLCTWDTEMRAFKLVRLYDLPRHDELLERGDLGDLVTRRVVDEYLAPQFEEKRKEKALAWLRKLP